MKRGIDALGAGAGLVALAPLLAMTAVAILAKQGRPIFFRQVRPGLGGRSFSLVKFRTMRAPRPEELLQRTIYETDGDRVTPLGKFLRSTSIDELPELWNVLRGEMSLVGPRPLLLEYLDQYSPEERRRHDMPPGITGWAAVNGRNSIPFRERLQLDVWYVDHWSLWLDLKILLLTAHHVLRRKDVADTEPVEGLGFPASTRSAASVTADPERGGGGGTEPPAPG